MIVTGAAGFIGSHFVNTVLTHCNEFTPNSRLVALDALKYSGKMENLSESLLDSRVQFVEGDILNKGLLEDLIEENDLVVNFAAESHVDRSIQSSAEFVSTNVLGVNTILEACNKKGTRRFLQVSTDEVYGSITKGSADEKFQLDPNSPYAASKAGADLLVKSFGTTHDLDTVVTRSSNNYGPRQFPEKLIPVVISHAVRNREIPIYGSGEQTRDWIHVYDNCIGILAALIRGKKGEIYNLGGSNEITNISLVSSILEILGAEKDLIEHIEDRKGHDLRYSLDSGKAKIELGFEPKVNFREGLRKTIEWYVDNPSYLKELSKY